MSAIVSYRVNSQKIVGLFDSILNKNILDDICRRVTGESDYQLIKQTDTYNRGRLVTINYNGWNFYITLSETSIDGRNSSMQSVPTALNIFWADPNPNKQLFYYFLPIQSGNPYTEYHIAYYRLLMTAGVIFLNISDIHIIEPYQSIDEFISDRDVNKKANRSNNSSYITKESGVVQIYAKVYGASKYESTLFGIAASKLLPLNAPKIQLFNINEQDLSQLPQASLNTFESLGNIEVFDTNYTFEKNRFFVEDKLSLRSPLYQYHLFSRLGNKRCALCGCEIPEIIQGAHIWGVSQISDSNMSDDDKFKHAINGHNGLWLCSNHHKLFDTNIIRLENDGNVLVRKDVNQSKVNYIKTITLDSKLPIAFLSDEFKNYVNMRNSTLPAFAYNQLMV